MATTVTARQIIDEARTQDARFFDLEVPDGALVLHLNTIHRRLLLTYADSVQPLVNQSQQVAAQVSGSLVGVDENGDPYYLTTVGQGFPVLNAGTVSVPIPYVDFSGVPISLDPFGVNGSTPGFPLPSDLVKVIFAIVGFADGNVTDLDIILESSRNNTNTHNVTAFINGNRLVPVRRGGVLATGGWPDLWTSVTSVTLTYLAVPTLATLDSVLTIPTVLQSALVAAVADHLARAVPPDQITSAEKTRFAEAALSTAETMRLMGTDMLQQVTQNSITYYSQY